MGEKIFIVDDEPSNRKILAQELVHRGYAVDTAGGGREALARLDATAPDLLVLDYMMQDLSGLELLGELRKRGNETPVIMITAYGSVDRAVEAMKAGAYDFITRPFDPDHIDLVIRKALEHRALKRAVAVLSEEVRDRYHLIVGESDKHLAAPSTGSRRDASDWRPGHPGRRASSAWAVNSSLTYRGGNCPFSGHELN